MRSRLGLVLTALLTVGAAAEAPPRPDQVAFRRLYQELVETDTTLSAGSCTLAAERMAAHLRRAGFADGEITLFAVPEHPKEGGLVAVLPGTDAKARPILLLAHIDVVEARREDWARDPFRLVEEKGYLFARGAFDDKAMAAVWTDLMVRLRRDGPRPRRTVKLALTCGEETSGAFNGAEWLAKNRRDLIDAQFALNEGGGGLTDGKGRVILQTMQVGEKLAQSYTLTATEPGGHSSRPVPENAIYRLSAALTKVAGHEFPVRLNPTTTRFFALTGQGTPGPAGQAMQAIARDPGDAAAAALLSRDPSMRALLRTTCVATLVQAGHAVNALPQRAMATVNCRIAPGDTVAGVGQALTAAVGDAKVAVAPLPPVHAPAVPPPLDPAVLGPAATLAKRYFPGVPVVPTMSAGATDGLFLNAAGIPTYGVPGIWVDPDLNGIHGLNERLEVRALMVGRDYLTDLVRAYADTR